MIRPRPGIGPELLPVALILLSMAGSWYSIAAMHRRGATPRREAAAVVQAPAPEPEPAERPIAPESPPPPPLPVPVPVAPPAADPTQEALTSLTIAQAEQLLEAQLADRKAEALETARRAAVADSQRWKRRDMLVRTQVDALTDRATKLLDELNEVALERDVLSRERDALKAALAKARARSSYAVLPHKGPNGTWRRPIIIECHDGMATLQPDATHFSLLELSGLFGQRSSPIIAAVAREVVRVQSLASPDGAPIVPYIFFVVRPDGIRPYYSARAQLEPLGIAFGYELVDQAMEIDYPDLNNIEEWDGTGIGVGPPGRPGAGGPMAANQPSNDRPWPASPRRDAAGRGSVDPSETFVWPTRPAGNANGRGGEIDATRGGPDRTTGGRGGRGGANDPVAPEPSTVARDGLGRGGSGVDPIPSGIPVIDLDKVVGRHGAAGDSPTRPGVGDEPRFGREDRLTAIDPDAMPGLVAPEASAVTPGRPGIDPSRAGGSMVGRDQANAPGNGAGTGTGPRPQAGATPTRVAPVSPPASTAVSLNPDQGAPPPLSALARLAGSAGPPGSGAAGQPSGLSSGSNHFGAPMPLPTSHGMDPDPGSGSDPGPDAGGGADPGGQGGRPGGGMSGARARPDRKGPTTVEVPFEIVVACSPEGVVIHPGGYRLSSQALKANDGLLMKHLKTIVQGRKQVDPKIHPRPSVRFVIEPGGSETYRDARRQTMMSGHDWPVALQVSDSSILDTVTGGPW